jgi:hypothetical protein
MARTGDEPTVSLAVAAIIATMRERGLTEADILAVVEAAVSGEKRSASPAAERMRRYRGHRKESGLPIGFDGNAFVERLAARDGSACVYCGTTEHLAVDHMVPVCQGGTDDIDNLARACRFCNSRKAGRKPEEAGFVFVSLTAENSYKNFVLRTCSQEPRTEKPSPFPPIDINSTPLTPPVSSLRSVHIRLREVFEKFWAVYPKRTNRKAALAKLETALKAGVDPEKILTGAARYAEHVKFTEPQFIKAPDAWLNAGKWDDELPAEPQQPPARAGPQRSSGDGMTVVLQKLREQVNGQSSSGIKDISPTGVSEPGASDPSSRVSQPTGKPSGGGEILDFRPASPDARRSPASHSEAARTFEWPDPTWEYR